MNKLQICKWYWRKVDRVLSGAYGAILERGHYRRWLDWLQAQAWKRGR